MCFKVLEADAIVQQSEEERYYLRQLDETNDEAFTQHLDIQTQGIKDVPLKSKAQYFKNNYSETDASWMPWFRLVNQLVFWHLNI